MRQLTLYGPRARPGRRPAGRPAAPGDQARQHAAELPRRRDRRVALPAVRRLRGSGGRGRGARRAGGGPRRGERRALAGGVPLRRLDRRAPRGAARAPHRGLPRPARLRPADPPRREPLLGPRHRGLPPLHLAAPRAAPASRCLGPVYAMAGYGDILRFWIDARVRRPLRVDRRPRLPHRQRGARSRGALDREERHRGRRRGRSTRARPTSGATPPRAGHPLLHALRPGAPAPADPRPGLPLVFFDRALGRVLARTALGARRARCSTTSATGETISHQFGTATRSSSAARASGSSRSAPATPTTSRRGRPSTTTRSPSRTGSPPRRQAALASSGSRPATSARGGQWTNGMNAGDPRVRIELRRRAGCTPRGTPRTSTTAPPGCRATPRWT